MTKLAEQLKQGADQAWESLSDGWRELGARASSALTRYWPTSAESTPARARSAAHHMQDLHGGRRARQR